MKPVPICLLLVSSFLLMPWANSLVDNKVRNALMTFLYMIDGRITGAPEPSFGWNSSSDPCQDKWKGVSCDGDPAVVRNISLRGFNFFGVIYTPSLCKVHTLTALDLEENNLPGPLPSGISDCRSLTQLYIGHNQFSGQLPYSLANLTNLKRIDISYNQFSGTLPAGLSKISGLVSFLAQNNELIGEIPEFNFSNMEQFNVSYNNFNGSIPDGIGQFNGSSFIGNPDLCGPPLAKTCNSTSPTPSPDSNQANGVSKHQTLVACALMSLVMLLFP